MASKQETLEDVLLVVADVDGALVTPDRGPDTSGPCRGSENHRGWNCFYNHQRPASTRYENVDRRS